MRRLRLGGIGELAQSHEANKGAWESSLSAFVSQQNTKCKEHADGAGGGCIGGLQARLSTGSGIGALRGHRSSWTEDRI